MTPSMLVRPAVTARVDACPAGLALLLLLVLIPSGEPAI
jgi:hypothetical protein